MLKSITQKFGSPTVGKKSKKQTATARVVKVLPRKGVTLVFTGESATKPWLRKGARIVVRGSHTCLGRHQLPCRRPARAHNGPRVQPASAHDGGMPVLAVLAVRRRAGSLFRAQRTVGLM